MRKLIAFIALWQWLAMVSVALGQSSEIPSQNKIDHQDFNSFFENRPQFESARSDENYHVLLHFDKIPSKQVRQQLNRQNIQLVSYVSDRSYRAVIPQSLSATAAKQLGIIAVSVPQAADKMTEELKHKDYPEWAEAGDGKIDVAIVFSAKASLQKIEQLLNAYNAKVLNNRFRNGHVVEARLTEQHISTLAESPLVDHMDIIQEPAQRLNHETGTHQRVNVLNSSATGGRQLNGDGVVIGVGDGGQLGNHIDFGDRVINAANGTYSSFGAHGDHVSGIIAGGGNLDPRNRGMAGNSTIITQKTSLVTFYTEDYFTDHGMVLTNNSYGTSASCTTNGTYNYTSSNLDWQLNEFPEILHVFAAGNSGGGSCDAYPQGYRTVLRYYQSSKNVLTVGSVTEDLSLWVSSSRGPVEDGRLKPEICGVGATVLSTGRDYNYWSANGTSMSAPSVTGTLALLYQRYRQLHSDANPEGALIKAIACNTADDLGNKGPDYAYGFGIINGRRAVKTIEEQRYASGQLSTGESNSHEITVPSGTQQVKIMLYWLDKEAEPFPTKALVNDLDLKVSSPNNTTYLPWVLNHDPAAVADLATRQVDTLNNIEQVTIDQPAAGTYRLDISGSLVPFGPQKYYITYEFIQEEVVLTHPFGAEQLIPGNQELIQWDADPTNTETFTLEYSINNGASWTTIAQNLPADQRLQAWTVPDAFTGNGKIRVRKSGGLTATNTDPFIIMPTPDGVLAEPKCEGLVQLRWNALDGASEYDVMMYNGSTMEVLATVSDTQYLVDNNLVVGEQYWFALQAKANAGFKGCRTIAISAIPENDSTCPWNNDPKLAGIKIDTQRGRYETVSALGDNESMQVKVKNTGANDINNFFVSYQINDNPPVTEQVTATVTSGDSLLYRFQQGADLSSAGRHTINAWVAMEEDGHTGNDTLMAGAQAVQLENDPVTFPMQTGVEDAVPKTYVESYHGLEGIYSWDFETTGNGILEVNNGEFYLSPVDPTDGSGVDNEVIMTLNLSNYDINSQYFYLKFKYAYNQSGVEPLSSSTTSENKVWVRGSDTDNWIELLKMDVVTGDWEEQDLLSINNALMANGQDLSSSLQIKFTQQDIYGYTLGGISVYQALVLPVDYQEFKVVKLEDNVLLQWKTGHEENSDYFEVQLADSEAAFSNQQFEPIGRVEAVGDGAGSWTYQFIDEEPAKSGNRYYRLKQVDKDGKFEHSPIRVIAFQESDTRMKVFPNPFQDKFQFSYTPPTEEVTRIVLMDAQGKVLQQFIEESQKGERFTVRLGETLPNGTYFIQVSNGLHRKTIPVIKQGL
ncbi:MAG: S8 family peptidase [Bacteroidota bacterium]